MQLRNSLFWRVCLPEALPCLQLLALPHHGSALHGVQAALQHAVSECFDYPVAMSLLRRCADVFIGQCIPFLLVLAKAQPAVAPAALEQAMAVQELFGSNLKLGLPSAQQAAKQLLVQLYAQVWHPSSSA